MKFTLFFLGLTLYSLWLFISMETSIKYLLLWLILNLMVMTMAYALNKSNLILDKKEDGSVNLFPLLINLPWLFFSWTVFALQMFISKESRVDKIKGSSISIASRPSKNFDYASYDIVVDLTSEFLKERTKGVEYISYSNLDGMPLSKSYENVAIFKNKKVLVHCANGHGRSALFVARLFVDLELVKTFKEGLALIKKSRPLAVPNAGQLVYKDKKQ